MLSKAAINFSAKLAKTNSKVGKQYRKCKSGKMCSEKYIVGMVIGCNNCEKIMHK